MLLRPIGDVAFEIADADRKTFGGANAFDLALRFLRANTSGDRWERVVAQKALRGLGDFAGGEQVEKIGDVNADRAAANAARILALQAALGFEQRQLLGESEIDLTEIAGARAGILLRHFLSLNRKPLFSC